MIANKKKIYDCCFFFWLNTKKKRSCVYAYWCPKTFPRPVLSTPVIIKFLSVSVCGTSYVFNRFLVASALVSNLREFSFKAMSSLIRRSCSCNRFQACLFEINHKIRTTVLSEIKSNGKFATTYFCCLHFS